MTEQQDESLDYVRELKSDNIDFIIQQDPDVQGTIEIDVRENGGFDLTLYKGADSSPQKIEDISKEKLIELMEKRL